MNRDDLDKIKKDYYYLLDHFYEYKGSYEELELIGYWYSISTNEWINEYKELAINRTQQLILGYTKQYNITIVDEDQIFLIDTTSTSGKNDTTVELKS